MAEVANHVVFAEPDNDGPELQAAALEPLGYHAESGAWRNFHLTGALELRRAPPAAGGGRARARRGRGRRCRGRPRRDGVRPGSGHIARAMGDGTLHLDGDADAPAGLSGLLETSTPNFNIVEPCAGCDGEVERQFPGCWARGIGPATCGFGGGWLTAAGALRRRGGAATFRSALQAMSIRTQEVRRGAA